MVHKRDTGDVIQGSKDFQLTQRWHSNTTCYKRIGNHADATHTYF